MRRRALSAGGRPRGHRAKPSRGLPATDGAPARLLPPAQPARHRARRGSDRGHPGRGPGGRGGRTVIVLKSAREIALMRRAGHILAGVVERLRASVRPGMSTLDIDEDVEAYIHREGAAPAFKGYRGFPATVGVPINEEVRAGARSSVPGWCWRSNRWSRWGAGRSGSWTTAGRR